MSQQKYEGSLTGFFVLLVAVSLIVLPLGYLYYLAVKSALPGLPDLRAVPGFLGTGASRASDISLVAYLFILIPLMLVGFMYARALNFNRHKAVMTIVTLANWFIILYLMAVSYAGAVPFYSENDPQKLVVPTIHLVTGLVAQILATVSLIRMWFERSLPVSLKYEPIKPQMRLTLALWLITALLGISIYVSWYGVPFQGRPAPQGAATQAATDDAATPEAGATAAATAESTDEATPEASEEVTQEATP